MKTATRQASLPGYDLGDYVRESIDFLRAHEPKEGYYMGFSGGKDSITTLALCRLAGVKHQAFYACTRIDPPEIMRFIRREYPAVTWLYPKESFWALIQHKMPPMRTQRWCCDALKKAPAKDVPLKYRLMGIRAEESVRRASRSRIDNYRADQVLLKPIFSWPEWAVWEFIDSQRLLYPTLYDEGFGRIGCVVCPFLFSSKARLHASMERWPGVWRVFEHAVKRWFNSKIIGRQNRMQRFATADEFWKAYINNSSLSNTANEKGGGTHERDHLPRQKGGPPAGTEGQGANGKTSGAIEALSEEMISTAPEDVKTSGNALSSPMK